MLSRFARALTVGSVFAGLAVVAACGSRTGLYGTSSSSGFLPDGAPITDGPTTIIDGNVPDGPIACTPGKFTFDLAAAQLMFVIDRSGSMAFSLDGRRPPLAPGTISRWDTLRDALASTIAPFDSSLAMGATFYPAEGATGNDEACEVETASGIPPARGNTTQILSVFDNTVPIGGTPTAEAVRQAAQFVTGTRGVVRTMVLATDGAPNCNGGLDRTTCTCTSATGNCTGPDGARNCLDATRTIDVIRSIAQVQNIPVYVIGIGGTEKPEFLTVLDQMAVAGGRPRPTTPRHYNVQTAAEMKEALQTIQDSVAKCTYLTPSAPTDPSAISVEIDGIPIPRDTGHTYGWDWNDQAYGVLTFFGAGCTKASTGTPQITGVVRCEN